MPPHYTSRDVAREQENQQPSSPVDRWIGHVTLILVTACCLRTFSLPLRSSVHLMGFAQDDFYYYLKTAQSFATGHGSSFDGTTHTNGYHPLYFLLLSAVSSVLHGIHQIFGFLWLLDTASAVVIFCSARRIFQRTIGNTVLSQAFAIVALMPCIATISMQMETTLALPIGFALLDTACVAPWRYTPARCASLGLLSALLMLARLDAAILVLLLLVGLWVIRVMRVVFRPATMASFAVTGLPLPLMYFGMNRHYFHGWLPISGMAKELRHGWVPDIALLRPSFSGFTLLILAITLLCGIIAVCFRQRLRPEEKLLCFSAMLMPVFFYGTEMMISDWKLWPWYMYATRFAFVASLLVLVAMLRQWHHVSAPRFRLLMLAAALVALVRTHYKVDPAMLYIEHESQQLNAFAATHPGRYAMGDRAGMFGYLSASPVLQAEGLMMDRAYLEHIRNEDDLRSTLNGYGVDYYVAFVFNTDEARKQKDGCLDAEEPSIAGRHSLRMRSSLCEAPVYTLAAQEGKYFVFALKQ